MARSIPKCTYGAAGLERQRFVGLYESSPILDVNKERSTVCIVKYLNTQNVEREKRIGSKI